MNTDGWRTVRIDQLGEVIGGRQRSVHLTAGRHRAYLRVANVFDGFIDASDVFQMHFTDSEFGIYRLEPGDILLNEGQSLDLVGRAAMYRGDPPDCCFQNSLIRVRPNEHTDPQFLEYLLRHLQRSGRFAAIAARTTSIAHLGVNRLASLRTRVPSRDVQVRIAHLLDAWSNGLFATNRLIGAEREFKRGLMLQLLTGQKRFPAFANCEWHEIKLGAVFNERLESARDDLPLLAITGRRGIVPRDDINRRDSSAADKSKYKRILPGDIGYNTMRMWQGVSGLSSYEGIVSPAYTVVVPTARIDAQFAAQLFKLPATIDQFRRYSQGLVDDTLNLKYPQFAKVQVTVPGLDEQRGIAKVLRMIDTKIDQLVLLASEMEKQRSALVDLLLVGKPVA